jgi:hypothetical protein
MRSTSARSFIGLWLRFAWGDPQTRPWPDTNWAISDLSQTLAEKISDKIGGNAVHIDCADVKMPGN